MMPVRTSGGASPISVVAPASVVDRAFFGADRAVSAAAAITRVQWPLPPFRRVLAQTCACACDAHARVRHPMPSSSRKPMPARPARHRHVPAILFHLDVYTLCSTAGTTFSNAASANSACCKVCARASSAAKNPLTARFDGTSFCARRHASKEICRLPSTLNRTSSTATKVVR